MTAEGTTPSDRGWAWRLAIYSAILFASWNFNLLALPCDMVLGDDRPRARYLGPESYLALHRVALPPETHPLHPMLFQSGPPPAPHTVYKSQFGIQGVALAAVKNWTGIGNKTFITLAPVAFALLTAVTLAAVFAAAHRWLGPPVGDVACALGAATSVLVVFAPSLYWAPFLMLGPFALAWCLYPSATTPLRKAALFVAVGGAVGLKALAGYEYITVVILVPVAAAWFHQHRAGASLLRRFGAAAGLVSVGLMGFAAAMALHVAQIRAVFDEDGVAIIKYKATFRTSAPLGLEGPRDRRPGEPAVDYAIRCFLMYFDKRAVSIPAVLRHPREDVSLRWVTVGVLGFAALAWAGRRRLPRDDGALAGAALIGLAAACSWQVLAVNHMCVHRHLNLIVYGVSFLPLAYLVAGSAAKAAAERAGVTRWFGPVALGAVVALMGYNAADVLQERARARTCQATADAAVLDRIAAGGPISDPAAQAGLDTTQRIAEFSDYFLAEAGLLGAGASVGAATDPDGLILHGWMVGDFGDVPLPRGWPTDRPTARVVVVCDGVAVRCKVGRFNRPDVDAYVRRPEPGAGFRVVIPSEAVRPGVPLRVFVVSDVDPSRITEFTRR
jgi:hypothetical protein